MNLVVDIGNTATKLALFEGDNPVVRRAAERLDASLLDELSRVYPVERAIVSASGQGATEVTTLLRKRGIRTLEFTAATPVPINNAYLTPETLGCDRLAATVGAAVCFPAQNVLIIDFGTALTVDLVTADNTFRGGVISPGMQIRFRALHDYTAHLPLCGASGSDGLAGLTTREAVERGVMNGMTFEIEGYIARYREKFDGLQVIFTGGDAKLFGKRIKNTNFAECNPVLYGLNRILAYNASKEFPL